MPWGNDDESSEDEIAPKTQKALMSQDNQIEALEQKMDTLTTSNLTSRKQNDAKGIADKLEGPPYVMLIKNLDYEIDDRSLNTWLNEIGVKGMQGEAKVDINDNNMSDGNGLFTVSTIEDVEHAMTFHKKSFRGRLVRIFPKTKGGKPLNQDQDRDRSNRRDNSRNDRGDRRRAGRDGDYRGGRTDGNKREKDKTYNSYNNRGDRKGDRGNRKDLDPLPPPQFDAERPKLNIIPAASTVATNIEDNTTRNSSIFGTGKPRDASKDDFSKPAILIPIKEKKDPAKIMDRNSNKPSKSPSSSAPVSAASSVTSSQRERGGSISSRNSNKAVNGGKWSAAGGKAIDNSTTNSKKNDKDLKHKDSKVSLQFEYQL